MCVHVCHPETEMLRIYCKCLKLYLLLGPFGKTWVMEPGGPAASDSSPAPKHAGKMYTYTYTWLEMRDLLNKVLQSTDMHLINCKMCFNLIVTRWQNHFPPSLLLKHNDRKESGLCLSKPSAAHRQRSLSGSPQWLLSSGNALIPDAGNCLLVRTFTWTREEERSHSAAQGVVSTGWKYITFMMEMSSSLSLSLLLFWLLVSSALSSFPLIYNLRLNHLSIFFPSKDSVLAQGLWKLNVWTFVFVISNSNSQRSRRRCAAALVLCGLCMCIGNMLSSSPQVHPWTATNESPRKKGTNFFY